MSTKIIERKEFWKKELEKLTASGLSRSQYCRENGIDYERFGYWIKKLSSPSPEFIPVKVHTSEVTNPNATLCTIELRGHIIKIHDILALQFILERLS
jgi:hypothetical protein